MSLGGRVVEKKLEENDIMARPVDLSEGGKEKIESKLFIKYFNNSSCCFKKVVISLIHISFGNKLKKNE